MDIILEDIHKQKNNTRLKKLLFAVLLLCLLSYWSFFKAPSGFEPSFVHVERYQSLSQISLMLENQNIISSKVIFQTIVIFLKGDRNIEIGDYYIDHAQSVLSVARMFAFGEHNVNPIKVTFPEGFTVEDMANTLSEKLPNLNIQTFLALARTRAGYLFPDTYFFFPYATPSEIVSDLSLNFEKKILPLQEAINSSNKSLSEIIILSSIIEAEAKGKEDSYIIAGILEKRLDKGMLLQVDAAPLTYKEKGLPPYPINNPGLSSIKAVLAPVESPYFFYLHDKNGIVHYARTFAEHKKNITKYLK